MFKPLHKYVLVQLLEEPAPVGLITRLDNNTPNPIRRAKILGRALNCVNLEIGYTVLVDTRGGINTPDGLLLPESNVLGILE